MSEGIKTKFSIINWWQVNKFIYSRAYRRYFYNPVIQILFYNANKKEFDDKLFSSIKVSLTSIGLIFSSNAHKRWYLSSSHYQIRWSTEIKSVFLNGVKGFNDVKLSTFNGCFVCNIVKLYTLPANNLFLLKSAWPFCKTV